MNYLYVMLGGALGALLRYGVGRLCAHISFLSLPLGTFVVNIVGCFLLGLLSAWGELHSDMPRGLLLLLTVGMCGAFTTFSTFSADTIHLLDEGRLFAALSYVVASLVVGLLLFYAGRTLPHVL